MFALRRQEARESHHSWRRPPRGLWKVEGETDCYVCACRDTIRYRWFLLRWPPICFLLQEGDLHTNTLLFGQKASLTFLRKFKALNLLVAQVPCDLAKSKTTTLVINYFRFPTLDVVVGNFGLHPRGSIITWCSVFISIYLTHT